MEGNRLQLSKIEPKRIRLEVGYVYNVFDHWGDIKKRIEIKSINPVTRAIKAHVTTATNRGDYDHVFTPQSIIDELNSEMRYSLAGKMVLKKRLFFGKKRVLESV